MSVRTFRPRQSLGQNFLVDENIARKIVAALTPNPKDVVVEIGPGFGVLTKYILPRVARLVAVEIDRNLADVLRQKHSTSANLELVTGDFLELDLRAFVPEKGRLRVLGNIPYHITSPVIFKVLALRQVVHDMILMVQREVAERIVAGPGCKAYGILSVYSQLYSQPAILFHVSRNVFRPRPDVESSVVRWDFSQRVPAEIEDEKLLDRVIHAAFQQRRKMLRKSLKGLLECLKPGAAVDFDLEKRPEELTPEEFVRLSNWMNREWKKPT
ncbi:MAG: ribosomal RNA small subunit methyltransferase A [Calditrichaeota bacterium]|nr:MAG: ribosomal RNA small subunit methyltransferase A [Calditrichota bacterium]